MVVVGLEEPEESVQQELRVWREFSGQSASAAPVWREFSGQSASAAPVQSNIKNSTWS